MNMHDWESIASLMSTMGISKFACWEIDTELFHAVRISIQSIQCTADTLRSKPGKKCAVVARYDWGRCKEELNTSSVAVRFITSVDSMDPLRCLREESNLMCECKYYNRMHLHCRHGLAMCM